MHLSQLRDEHPSSEPGRELRFIRVALAVALVFSLKFAAYAWWVTPLWDIPDESGHFSFVQSLAEGEYPVLGEARMGEDVTRSWRGDKARPGKNWIAQHPPLFYAMDVPFLAVARASGADFEAQVRTARLLSALLGGLTVLGLALFLARATGNEYVALGGAVLFAATPMFTHLSTGVSHDPLVASTMAWAAFFCTRWLQSDQRRDLLLCALLVGMCAVTKITALALAVPFYFCLAWMLWTRSRGPRRGLDWLARCALAWLAMFLPVLLWMARNVAVYGNPLADSSMLAPGKHVAIGFLDLMRQHPFWQHTWLNFIGLVGWNGGPGSKLSWIQAHGFLAAYFSFVVAWAAGLAMLGPLLARATERTRLWVACIAVAVVAGLFFFRWPTHTIALRTCLAIMLAAIVTGSSQLRGAWRGEARPWLLATSAACVLLFAAIYYHHLWSSFTGIMRATHGRYFYPVAPMLMLLLAWPLRHAALDRGFLWLAAVGMLVSDAFYLHQAFPLFRLT